MAYLTESTVEEAALTWLEATGWQVAHGPDISLGGDALTLTFSQRERESYSEEIVPPAVLVGGLWQPSPWSR
ncbi:MAG: hypothetical protein NNA31_05810 [Nitrospira sp.]|nr:hypothetical protein [Nitrospira sp.]